jgi:pilus assembly protein CpaB
VRTRGLVLAVAFLLAATATLAVFMYVKGVRDEATTGGDTVRVLVAKEDVPAGTRLDDLVSDGQFETVSVEEDQVVEGAVTTLTELSGRETSFPILAGEQISSARLRGSAKQLPGGTLGIPSGYVALTLPLDSARIVGDVVKRGDHVIVFGHFPKEETTVTLAPDVQVLKVQDPFESGVSSETTEITLAVRPLDGQEIVFGQNMGTVWLALVPPNEQGKKVTPITFAKVVAQ